jgi:hypothetical protein
MSLDAFARSKGVSTTRLRNWRRRLAHDEAVHFVPIVQGPTAPPTLEVCVRGVVLRAREALPPQQLAGLVAALVAALPPC